MGRNLFIAFTPYQLVNASTIVMQENIQDSQLLLLDGYFDFEKINIEFLSSIFCDIKIFSKMGRFVADCKKKREFQYYKNKYDNIYASSEANFIIQAIVKMNPKARYVHFEDGFVEYDNSNEFIGKKVIARQKLLMIIISSFKSNYSINKKPGVFKRVENIYALYPEYLREEIKCKNKKKIHQNFFNTSIKKIFKSEKSLKTGIIVCLDHSDIVDDNKIDTFFLILDNLLRKKRNIQIYYKYHPRETSFYLNRFNLDGVIELDKNQPIENYVVDSQEVIVISNVSSSMHTIKFMSDSNHVICINNITNIQNNNKYEKYLEFLKKDLKVLFPETVGELLDIIF